MSGDLLEDLMSSEGEFGEEAAESNTEELWIYLFLMASSIHPVYIPHLFLCVFHLQCSRLSSACPLHPATTTTYTTWMRQKACVTFSMSPFSTSDLQDCCRSGKQLPKYANLPQFSPNFPPLKVKLRRGAVLKDTSALTLWAQSGNSSMYSLVKKYRREQNILFTAFPRKQSKQVTHNYIFGLLCMVCM